MAKPASGTALNTGNGFYANLANAWAMLEGSGSTTADSVAGNTGTRNDLTHVTWGTDADGPILQNDTDAAGNTVGVDLASTVNFGSAASWALAWRGKYGGANTGVWMGSTGGARYLAQNVAPYLIVHAAAVEGDAGWSAGGFPITIANLNDYCLSWNHADGKLHLYLNGTDYVAAGVAQTTPDLQINRFLNGYGQDMKGSLSYVYFWAGRFLSASDATSLSADPYQLFGTGGGGGGGGSTYPALERGTRGVQRGNTLGVYR